MFEEMGVHTGYNLEGLVELGQLVEKLIGHQGSDSILRAGINASLYLQHG
jgi:hypothetical protein